MKAVIERTMFIAAVFVLASSRLVKLTAAYHVCYVLQYLYDGGVSEFLLIYPPARKRF